VVASPVDVQHPHRAGGPPSGRSDEARQRQPAYVVLAHPRTRCQRRQHETIGRALQHVDRSTHTEIGSSGERRGECRHRGLEGNIQESLADPESVRARSATRDVARFRGFPIPETDRRTQHSAQVGTLNGQVAGEPVGLPGLGRSMGLEPRSALALPPGLDAPAVQGQRPRAMRVHVGSVAHRR
jgi:hypothetical protein